MLANLLALAAVCPFVGALSDLVGRRYVAITGAAFIVLGMIVCSTAHHMNTFIGMISHSKFMNLTDFLQLAWHWQAPEQVSTN